MQSSILSKSLILLFNLHSRRLPGITLSESLAAHLITICCVSKQQNAFEEGRFGVWRVVVKKEIIFLYCKSLWYMDLWKCVWDGIVAGTMFASFSATEWGNEQLPHSDLNFTKGYAAGEYSRTFPRRDCLGERLYTQRRPFFISTQNVLISSIS